MPRRREVPKREILPDPKFGNVEVFTTRLFSSGAQRMASLEWGPTDSTLT